MDIERDAADVATEGRARYMTVMNSSGSDRLRRPVENLRDHIILVRGVGTLILLAVCASAIAICVVNARHVARFDREGESVGCADFDAHDYHDHGGCCLNLSTCIFVHRHTMLTRGANYTVCQTDDGSASVDIFLNGSFIHVDNVEQWKVLKLMMPRIDSSIKKAEAYRALYIPSTMSRD
jgi:hypothetical protein